MSPLSDARIKVAVGISSPGPSTAYRSRTYALNTRIFCKRTDGINYYIGCIVTGIARSTDCYILWYRP